MKDRIRKAGILFAALTVSASFTIVSPFYSKIAQDKGIEKWLIGLVYSSFPISSLAISFFLQPFMQRLGRTKILLFGMFLESLNILLMALVPFSNFAMALFLSFTSRIIGGWSSAMLTISSYSILTSDYPDEIAKMIALMEIVSGIGYIMGPLIGSIIYIIGGFSTSCIILSIIILLYTPILYICVGPSRPYILSNDHIIMSHVAMKPKILLDIGMQLLIMFMVGYILPTTQLHLLSFGIKEENSGYWFSINTLCYFASSFLVSLIPEGVNKPRQMLFGNFVLVLGLLCIGPCPFLLPENSVFVGLGLMLFGLAAGFVYIPSMPHMLEVAKRDYGYENDHRLNDAASEITNISMCIGEILGPVVSAILDTFVGYAMSATIVAFMVLSHAIMYMILSDAVTYKTTKAEKIEYVLSSELITIHNKL